MALARWAEVVADAAKIDMKRWKPDQGRNPFIIRPLFSERSVRISWLVCSGLCGTDALRLT